MIMKSIDKCICFLFACSLLFSCSTESDQVTVQNSLLRLQTDINSTRSVITGNVFSKSDSIGLFVMRTNGTSLYSNNSFNMPAVFDGVNWILQNPISLDTVSGRVYAYYPYQKSLTSTIFPINLMPDKQKGQADYLYGVSSAVVNIDNPTAVIHFNHALTRISLQISSTSSYAGILNSVILRKPTSGKMNVFSGKVSFDIENSSHSIVLPENVSIGKSVIPVDILAIPYSKEGDAEVVLVIDGKEYAVKITNPTWSAGVQYVYPISVNITATQTVSLSVGTPDITAWGNTTQNGLNVTSDNENKATGTLSAGGTVGNMVDLGLSVKWADHNVGATNPEDYGGYFAWGETETKSDYSTSTSKWYGVAYSSLQSQGVIDTNGNLTAIYDAAVKNWGKNWRIPTKTELDELKTKCTWTWTTSNGVYGRNVVGPNGNSIFLPAAGFRLSSDLRSVGSIGLYWSSSADVDYNSAYGLRFDSGSYVWGGLNRYDGYSVRPVSE
jgi:hypothetical protein